MRIAVLGARSAQPRPAMTRRQTIAIHEAGHAVAARMLGATDIQVSVGRRSGAFAFTIDGSEVDEAVILLAGREAEVMLTGRDPSGSSHDLKQARRVLRGTGVDLASVRGTAAELVRGARLDIEAEAPRLLDVALSGRRAA